MNRVLTMTSAITVICLLLGAPHSSAASADERAAQVRVAYVYRLSSYVSWPALSAHDDISVCFVNAPSMDRAAQSIDGRMVNGHKIVSRSVGIETLARCDVAYVRGTRAQVRDILSRHRGQAVLTITDGADAHGLTGVIHLFTRYNTIRFMLDASTAAQSGLTISEKLSRLSERET